MKLLSKKPSDRYADAGTVLQALSEAVGSRSVPPLETSAIRESFLQAAHCVGSFRDDETAALPSGLPEMQLLKLSRLNSDNIAALSESMLGEAGRQPHVLELLQRETEGNVFFLVEVTRALAEEAGQLELVGVTTLRRRCSPAVSRPSSSAG